jgi:hypothetical protein
LNVYMLRKVLRIEISTGAVKKGNWYFERSDPISLQGLI